MTGAEDAVTMARWKSAEDTLYASMVAEPQTFERVVGLTGVLVDHLRATVEDLPGLLAASGRGTELIAEISPESLVPWIPAEMALSAACALRNRELRAAAERSKRVSTLAQGRADGQTWVRLEAAVDGMHALLAPALIVHVATGAAIAVTTEMDPSTGGACFVVAGVTIDVDTGDVEGPLASLGPGREADTLAGRDIHTEEMKRLVERLDIENHLV